MAATIQHGIKFLFSWRFKGFSIYLPILAIYQKILDCHDPGKALTVKHGFELGPNLKLILQTHFMGPSTLISTLKIDKGVMDLCYAYIRFNIEPWFKQKATGQNE
jgi:hypothetical protein